MSYMIVIMVNLSEKEVSLIYAAQELHLLIFWTLNLPRIQ